MSDGNQYDRMDKRNQRSLGKGRHQLTTEERSKGGRASSSKQNMAALGEMGAKARWGQTQENE